jgi:hypothetical protein
MYARGGALMALSIRRHPCRGAPLPSPLSSRPKRTRISCYAALAGATNLDRKSGVAQWRDLPFLSVHPI